MSAPSVLVINDYAPLRDFFRFNLKARGYEVVDVISTPDIFVHVEKMQPDLVILDLMIGGTDGFELCRRVCSESGSAVIVINMRAGDSDLLRCLEMGVDEYINRPFGVDELMARIGAAMRHRKKAKEIQPVLVN
jgi:two-component system KDP operon response regulator KdpE